MASGRAHDLVEGGVDRAPAQRRQQVSALSSVPAALRGRINDRIVDVHDGWTFPSTCGQTWASAQFSDDLCELFGVRRLRDDVAHPIGVAVAPDPVGDIS